MSIYTIHVMINYKYLIYKKNYICKIYTILYINYIFITFIITIINYFISKVLDNNSLYTIL